MSNCRLQKLVDAAVEHVRPAGHHGQQCRDRNAAPVLDTTEVSMTACWQLTSRAHFFGTQIAAKQMIKQGGSGRIINITSVHEDWPMPGNTAYCLAKGGMRMLTRTAGRRTRQAQHPCCRGRSGGSGDTDQSQHHGRSGQLAQLDAAIPLGRMARPEEIASVVAFLAGDGASYLTATTIFADGGIMQSSVGL